MNRIEILFKSNYSALCLYSMHFTHDASQSEDLVMDCFHKLIERPNLLIGVTDEKQYIFKIVHNACIDYLHKNKSILLDDCDIPDIPNIDTDVIIRSECEAKLWYAIDQLPPTCKKILLMNKQDGMKYKDIALTLGISIKTVEAHISKALKRLKAQKHNLYFIMVSLCFVC